MHMKWVQLKYINLIAKPRGSTQDTTTTAGNAANLKKSCLIYSLTSEIQNRSSRSTTDPNDHSGFDKLDIQQL